MFTRRRCVVASRSPFLVLRLVGAGVADHVMCDYHRTRGILETLIEGLHPEARGGAHAGIHRSQWYCPWIDHQSCTNAIALAGMSEAWPLTGRDES